MSIKQVLEFHRTFGHPVGEGPTLLTEDRFNLRLSLIREELEETIEAYHENDLVKVSDGLADLSVVISGTMIEFGFFMDDGVEPFSSQEASFVSPGLYDERAVEYLKIHTLNYLGNLYSSYFKQDKGGVFDSLHYMLGLVYVTANSLGIPLDEINEVVHKANMSKLGEDGKPIYRESDNKILKGPNFRPPEEDIEAILKAHGAEL